MGWLSPMYGIDGFTPIINPPEVAILGVGRINQRLVRRESDLLWRQVITLSLTIDHRAVASAIDGGDVPFVDSLPSFVDGRAQGRR